MTFQQAMTMKTVYENVHSLLAKELLAVSGDEKRPMGLTPDHIKQTDEWKAAYNAERAAFKQVQKYNQWLFRNFKEEIKAARKR